MPSITGAYFASLRDESPVRLKSSMPIMTEKNGMEFLAPLDPLGGGTWLGVNMKGCVIILLNGAFENHERKNYYSKSRGLIVTELLATEMPVVEWSLMDLDHIEPFTLLVWTEEKLFQLVWDGKEKYRILKDHRQAHIWSSSTLYDIEAKTIREEHFQNWIAMNPPVSKLTVLDFFKSFTDNSIGFLMNRNGVVQTLSYSFVALHHHLAEMDYYDFQSYTHQQQRIQFSSSPQNDCVLNRQ